MIFSDDRDKIKDALNSAISLLDKLNYDDQDYYSLEDIKEYFHKNIKNKINYTTILYTIYIYLSNPREVLEKWKHQTLRKILKK